jgi:hypothetical protein
MRSPALVLWLLVISSVAMIMILQVSFAPEWIILPVGGLVLAIILGWSLSGWRGRRELERVWHGQCPSCGYDLRASGEQCPECGKPIPHGSPPVLSAWKAQLRYRRFRDGQTLPAYGSTPQYLALDLPNDADLNQAFFDAQSNRLASLGFRHVGDVELAPTIPTIRRWIYRVMISEDGRVVASIDEALPGRQRWVQLISERRDGSFLVSEGPEWPRRRPARPPVVSGVNHRFALDLDVAALLNWHLQELLGATAPRTDAEVFTTLDDTLRMAQRIAALHLKSQARSSAASPAQLQADA